MGETTLGKKLGARKQLSGAVWRGHLRIGTSVGDFLRCAAVLDNE